MITKKARKRKLKKKELKAKSSVTYNDTIAELNMMSRSDIKPKMKRKVIDKYLSTMHATILCGEQWNFPDNFGSIAVIKETEAVDATIIKGFGLHNAFVFDELNNAFSIKMNSTTLNHLNYSYMPYPKIMALLSRVLKSNDKPIFRTQFT